MGGRAWSAVLVVWKEGRGGESMRNAWAFIFRGSTVSPNLRLRFKTSLVTTKVDLLTINSSKDKEEKFINLGKGRVM